MSEGGNVEGGARVMVDETAGWCELVAVEGGCKVGVTIKDGVVVTNVNVRGSVVVVVQSDMFPRRYIPPASHEYTESSTVTHAVPLTTF